MMNASPFVYGRTRTVDYRWLQPPILKLRIGFFADALEMCSPLLRKGERCFFICVDERACVFSTLLSIPGMLDQRGRTISFVFGYTVDPKAARDFAYYLPNLLGNEKQIIEKYVSSVKQAVASDTLVEIPSFPIDINNRSTKDLTMFMQNPTLHNEDVQFGSKGLSFSQQNASKQSDKISTNSSERWLETTILEIKSSINTPRMISNMDFSHLGSLIEEMPGSLRESRNQVAPIPSYGGSTLQEGTSTPDSLQQMRQFVGRGDSSDNKTEKTESGFLDSFSAEKTQPTFAVDESVRGLSEQTSTDRHPLINLFFGRKNKPLTKTPKDE